MARNPNVQSYIPDDIRVELIFSYEERELAKKLRCRWWPERKTWFSTEDNIECHPSLNNRRKRPKPEPKVYTSYELDQPDRQAVSTFHWLYSNAGSDFDMIKLGKAAGLELHSLLYWLPTELVCRVSLVSES
jgi:hypothetical protein